MKRKAVVLLSGGLDSAVTLFFAKSKGYECHCLNFDYGQRHGVEMAMAKRLARSAGAGLKTVKISLPWGGSSLLDKKSALPLRRKPGTIKKSGVPSTYVPARNTIFLSFAASYAEAIGANAIFIGAHYEDSSGYPDCRPGYLEAIGRAIKMGTKRGLENKLKLEFPLIKMSKREIIGLGQRLRAPLKYTWSCYKGGGLPCGECDSCVLREKGFKEAGIKDPAGK
ncbi:MAG: 7-cyano-7-deazaguanine synthase QueC [Candidatus Omnitrophica bacterium]|nr:7-cyano-7-deazaguanine synthase QueC [Candidatus Omnitrophota bacterium]